MADQGSVREGMTVYSSDGEALGRVVSCAPATFVIEKGRFFRKDYVARYEDVARVEGEEVRLSRPRDALGEAGGMPREGTYSEGSSVMGPGGGFETAPTAIGLEGDRGAGERGPALRYRPEDEDASVQFGEDPGTLPPPRSEPED